MLKGSMPLNWPVVTVRAVLGDLFKIKKIFIELLLFCCDD